MYFIFILILQATLRPISIVCICNHDLLSPDIFVEHFWASVYFYRNYFYKLLWRNHQNNIFKALLIL